MLSQRMRLLAIGDIHGCLTALDTLLEEVRPGREDVLVTLGDYVDRGPNSKGVLDRLVGLAGETTLVPLLGNHDVLFQEAIEGMLDHFEGWLRVGGAQTVESYGSLDAVPKAHYQFFDQTCRLWYEPDNEDVFFVHGSAFPGLPLEDQSVEWLLWHRIHEAQWPHVSGRTMVCGHTAQRSGLPLILPHALCIDTWAFGDGWLTCYDVHAASFIQANEAGAIRRLSMDELRDQ
jgi:serine/threonine protein phosphatase 1